MILLDDPLPLPAELLPLGFKRRSLAVQPVQELADAAQGAADGPQGLADAAFHADVHQQPVEDVVGEMEEAADVDAWQRGDLAFDVLQLAVKAGERLWAR